MDDPGVVEEDRVVAGVDVRPDVGEQDLDPRRALHRVEDVDVDPVSYTHLTLPTSDLV
mgnify:CR=1 FL=1